MNKIIDLQKRVEELSKEICAYCKPLILDKNFSKEVRQLLSSETDLRLSVEMILEVESKKEADEKIIIAKEEAEIILYFLTQINSKTKNKAKSIIDNTKQIIDILNTL